MNPSETIEALLEALNNLGRADAVQSAFWEDAVIEARYTGPTPPPLDLRGHEAITRWLAAPRGTCTFFASQMTVVEEHGDEQLLRVRYGYHHDRFTAWGWWDCLCSAGRIRRLVHRPDPLPNTPRGWWEQHGVRITGRPIDEPIFPEATTDGAVSAGAEPSEPAPLEEAPGATEVSSEREPVTPGNGA